MTDHYDKIAKILKDEGIQASVAENVSMADFTSFRAGGDARMMVIPAGTDALKSVLRLLSDEGCRYMIIGNGSNILVKDSGYDGVVVKIGKGLDDIRIDGDVITAGSGALMGAVARAAAGAELTGFEFASGIPGSAGGAVFMNAGAYGGEMRNILRRARIISKDGTKDHYMTADELDMSYRHSALHESGDVAAEVEIKLEKGKKEDILEKMSRLMEKRNSKQPVSFPSAGSFFKRPEGYFAGKLIQDAGLKGLSVGGAQVSELHSGFIINTGGATATDIIRLKDIVQARVFDKFGVKLETEVRIIG